MTLLGLRLKYLLKGLLRETSDIQSLARKRILSSGESIDKTIVIDFSSPNIAKPFHFGHLKSTILGNFLANLHEFFGNRVTRINYIGDWGTQYGLLSLGLEESGHKGDRIDLPGSKQPLKFFQDVYIKANERGQSDEMFYNEARRRFTSMDLGKDSEQLKRWRQIRDLSVSELKQSYKTLGIEFDVFEFESDYAQKSIELVKEMEAKKLVQKSRDGALIAQVQKNNKILEIPMLKSDGSSLYVSRDVTAAIERMKKFKYDKLLYVAGANQEKHFHCVKEIVKHLGYKWHDKLDHVKMGKVIGMSSRSGNQELLSDIIEKVTKQSIEITRKKPTSKVEDEIELRDVGLQLALTTLYVFDMRKPRTLNYHFDWDAVMSSEQSGINLQTCLTRLSSLLEKASETGLEPFKDNEELLVDAVNCEEALCLIEKLNEFFIQIHTSYLEMDPKSLIYYALGLCSAINRARRCKKLRVVGETNTSWARTRLSLFQSSHCQLELIIKLIGLRPLRKC